MTRNHYSNQGGRKSGALILIACFAAVSIAVGSAYFMGVFEEDAVVEPRALNITLSSDRLDFGEVALNATATRQLIVRNDEEQPLTAQIVVDGSQYRVHPEQLILHPGVGSRIRIELVGSKAGTLENELQIVVAAPDTKPLVVALAGQVLDSSALEIASNGPSRKGRYAATPRSASRESRQGRGVRAPEAPSSQSGSDDAGRSTMTVTGAAVNTQPAAQQGATPAQTTPQANVSTTSRRAVSSPSSKQGGPAAGDQTAAQPRPGYRVTTGEGGAAVPFRSVAERPAPVPSNISSEEAKLANNIPSKVQKGDEELPEELPDEDEFDRDKDLFDREDDDDPFQSPTLTISGQSTVRIMGSLATFYPQQIGVMGTTAGGFLSLTRQLEFPTVPLAFGESMLFAQTAPGANGGFDPVSGEVTIEVPLQAVDADGDAAPLNLVLTTGTVYERNESGNVVSMSGSPRVPETGIMRLVGIAKIPVGFRNGAEQHLAVFEILASLSFGDSLTYSNSAPMGRIGG